MTDEPLYITKQGLEKIKEELRELKSVKMKEIAQRIEEAKELGDLSENAEYQAAREEQSMVAGRILELEDAVNRSQIIHASNTDVVNLGSTIHVRNHVGSRSFTIVGSAEANPVQGTISNESPLGRAFLGHKVGDSIEAKTPGGVVVYTIERIES